MHAIAIGVILRQFDTQLNIMPEAIASIVDRCYFMDIPGYEGRIVVIRKVCALRQLI